MMKLKKNKKKNPGESLKSMLNFKTHGIWRNFRLGFNQEIQSSINLTLNDEKEKKYQYKKIIKINKNQ